MSLHPPTGEPDRRGRAWLLMGMTIPPIAAMTIYLLWIWPRPGGASFLAQAGPYFLSLLTGLPSALRLCRGAGRIAGVVEYLLTGFVLLWLYALAVLCGVRDVCL